MRRTTIGMCLGSMVVLPGCRAGKRTETHGSRHPARAGRTPRLEPARAGSGSGRLADRPTGTRAASGRHRRAVREPRRSREPGARLRRRAPRELRLARHRDGVPRADADLRRAADRESRRRRRAREPVARRPSHVRPGAPLVDRLDARRRPRHPRRHRSCACSSSRSSAAGSSPRSWSSRSRSSPVPIARPR